MKFEKTEKYNNKTTRKETKMTKKSRLLETNAHTHTTDIAKQAQ